MIDNQAKHALVTAPTQACSGAAAPQRLPARLGTNHNHLRTPPQHFWATIGRRTDYLQIHRHPDYTYSSHYLSKRASLSSRNVRDTAIMDQLQGHSQQKMRAAPAAPRRYDGQAGNPLYDPANGGHYGKSIPRKRTRTITRLRRIEAYKLIALSRRICCCTYEPTRLRLELGMTATDV